MESWSWQPKTACGYLVSMAIGGRPLPTWNQHSYHITNINDDLSVPVSEPDSWGEHNTYRAQFTPGQAQRGVALSAAVNGLSGLPGATVVYSCRSAIWATGRIPSAWGMPVIPGV